MGCCYVDVDFTYCDASLIMNTLNKLTLHLISIRQLSVCEIKRLLSDPFKSTWDLCKIVTFSGLWWVKILFALILNQYYLESPY